MNKLVTLLFAAIAPIVLTASPAATQQWVKNYVASNTVSGGVSADWVINYIRTNTSATASTEVTESAYQTRAQNALAMSFVEASMSGLYALSFLYEVSSNRYQSVKLASANGGGWTNVVYECGITTNQTHEAVLVVDELSYNCATFSNYTAQNDFMRIVGNATNTINVTYTAITTNDYKTARGEN